MPLGRVRLGGRDSSSDEEDTERRDPSYRPSRPALTRASTSTALVPHSSGRKKRTASEEGLLLEEEQQKKAKLQAEKNFVESLKCPLSYCLFIDPVFMADGHTYEREDAEQYFLLNVPRGPLKSPLTNEILLHSNLTPNVAMRGVVENAVNSGSIEGELVDEYKKTMRQRAENAKVLADLQKKADRGDVKGMFDLANAYEEGRHGLKKDTTTSFTWFKRAADAGDATSTAFVGWKLHRGLGVRTNIACGAMYLGIAAQMGSEAACGILAEAYETGTVGFDVDWDQAAKFYRKMDKCVHKDAKPIHRERRDNLLGRMDREHGRLDALGF